MKLEDSRHNELPEHAAFDKVDTFGPGDDDNMHIGNTGDDEGDVIVSKSNSTLYVPIFLKIVLHFGVWLWPIKEDKKFY